MEIEVFMLSAERPFAPIHLDVVHTYICAHLGVRDLCSLMGVSRGFFFAFIADGAWRHIQKRLCAASAEFAVVFERHPWDTHLDGDGQRSANNLRPSGAKKRKLAWIMPRGGVWWTMKRLIYSAWKVNHLRKLYKCPTTRDVAALLIVGTMRLFLVERGDTAVGTVSLGALQIIDCCFHSPPVVVTFTLERRKIEVFVSFDGICHNAYLETKNCIVLQKLMHIAMESDSYSAHARILINTVYPKFLIAIQKLDL